MPSLATGTRPCSRNPARRPARLGAAPQPPYPRVTALRLDGVPWKYPFVPLNIGVFQEMREAILSGQPYQAHGWFISRQNPAMSLPDRGRTLQAFGKLDFIVTIDIIMNDTAWFSDVVLPEASYLERYDPLNIVGEQGLSCASRSSKPQGEGKSALWIYKQLGERLGLGDYFQYKDEEDYLKQQLAPLGVTLEDVRQKGYVDLPGETDTAAKPSNRPGTRPAERSRSIPPPWRRRVSPACRNGKNRPRPRPVSSTC